MSIVFSETKLQDGYLQVRWQADNPREWKRVLAAIKQMIPQDGRAFVKDDKAWTIAPQYLHIYQDIKENLSNDNPEELTVPLDERINEDAILGAFQNSLLNLSGVMRERALFAAKAAMGLIDAEVEFSISRGVFGAWDESFGQWVYEDGRYSSISPDEWDQREIASGYKRIQTALKNLESTMVWLDTRDDKGLFRFAMLERYGYRCHVCEARPASFHRLHMHRVLPGRLGGQYTEENVVLVCTSCHKRVEGMDWREIEAERAAARTNNHKDAA